MRKVNAPRLRSARAALHRAAAGLSAAGHRVAADGWPLLQATVGATAAWLIARYLWGHPIPYFAPIAAIVALNAYLGERGLNAVRLMQGVILGLLAGEVVLLTVGSGPGAMAVAILVALTVTRAIAGPPLVVIQAAVSAILVVAAADASTVIERLVDAVTGAGVALVFTQLLFPPEPLALLRRAEKAALTAIADGLATAADASARDDDELADRAVGELRDVRDHLAELRRVGRASTTVTRRAWMWRARATVVVRENENADHLDLLGSSCLVLARLVASADSDTRGQLQQPVRGLADVIASLARDLSDREIRQHAADRSLELATQVSAEAAADPDLAFATYGFLMVTTDVIAFAGVDLADAIEAIREGTRE